MTRLVKKQKPVVHTSIAVEKFEFTEGQSVKCVRAGFVPERKDKLVDGTVYVIKDIRRSVNGRNSDLILLEDIAGWWSAIRFEPVKPLASLSDSESDADKSAA